MADVATRGLSDLQAMILRLALRNKLSERRYGSWSEFGADLFLYEVLSECYGFPVSARGAPLRCGRGRLARSPLSPHFSPTEIGARRYASARVSASRACRRLEVRGLCERRWWARGAGVNLTRDGVTAARQIAAERVRLTNVELDPAASAEQQAAAWREWLDDLAAVAAVAPWPKLHRALKAAWETGERERRLCVREGRRIVRTLDLAEARQRVKRSGLEESATAPSTATAATAIAEVGAPMARE